MFRSITSIISAVSSFVANGHQILHHVSCSPSKIPYIGFSPVRLQTDIQPRPSLRRSRVKREVRMHRSQHSLYVATAAGSNSCSRLGIYNGAISQEASQSRGPWLANGLCCPLRSSLTTASSAPLDASFRLIFFVRPVFALRPRLGWHRGVPQFNPRISLHVPPLRPRRSKRLHMAVPSPFAPAFAIPAQARRTQRHHRRFSGGQFNGAAEFTSCYGPKSCSPDSGTDFYFRAFPSISHLIEESNMTTWVNSQFPRPDFHRLDTRPYGLHTELTGFYGLLMGSLKTLMVTLTEPNISQLIFGHRRVPMCPDIILSGPRSAGFLSGLFASRLLWIL